MSELTHFDEHGASRMFDTSAKPETLREARASGLVRMAPATAALTPPRGSAPWRARSGPGAPPRPGVRLALEPRSAVDDDADRGPRATSCLLAHRPPRAMPVDRPSMRAINVTLAAIVRSSAAATGAPTSAASAATGTASIAYPTFIISPLRVWLSGRLTQ